MALSIVRDSGTVRTADVLVFEARQKPAGDLFALHALQDAREAYLLGHAQRMKEIRRRALAALEREEREKAGGAGGE